MLNNRQVGRRRGRGNQRPQGNNGGRGAEQGNRIDNRARGNAPQMLEKYTMLARDAQQQGDRVMAEYYLQFADHYFRVVADSRARFEENRPRREEGGREEGVREEGVREEGGREEGGQEEGALDENGRSDWRRENRAAPDSDDGETVITAGGNENGYEANDRAYQQRPDRDRQPQNRSDNRQPRRNDYRRDEANAAPNPYEPRPVAKAEARPTPRPVATTETAEPARARRPRTPRVEPESNGFDASILPPAISVAEPEEKPAPRPRGRPKRIVAES